MVEYHKLVRDKIPEIIEADDITPVTRILNDSEYESALIQKLAEESREVALADTTETLLEELADLQDVLDALVNIVGSKEQLEAIRAKKQTLKGGFEDRIFLERTE